MLKMKTQKMEKASVPSKHFMVSAPGYETLITHIFTPDCPWLKDDAAFVGLFVDIPPDVVSSFKHQHRAAGVGKHAGNHAARQPGADFEQLKQALYDHTFDICNSLKAQGTPPDTTRVSHRS